MSERQFYVYMMASQFNGTIYIGVTSDLIMRVVQHKDGTYGGFTEKYDVKRLVWYETHGTAEDAICREKKIKEWKRDWKRNLIEHDNPHWDDLYAGICK